jgi:hypothetical protein
MREGEVKIKGLQSESSEIDLSVLGKKTLLLAPIESMSEGVLLQSAEACKLSNLKMSVGAESTEDYSL